MKHKTYLAINSCNLPFGQRIFAHICAAKLGQRPCRHSVYGQCTTNFEILRAGCHAATFSTNVVVTESVQNALDVLCPVVKKRRTDSHKACKATKCMCVVCKRNFGEFFVEGRVCVFVKWGKKCCAKRRRKVCSSCAK
eukprot:jgi/Antlo1/2256/280